MKTIIYGVGELCQKLLSLEFEKTSASEIMIIDSFVSGEVNGLAVNAPRALPDNCEINKVVVCSFNHFEEIYRFLIQMGVSEGKIYVPDINLNLISMDELLRIRRTGIIVCTLPKSGTVWINKCLHEMTRRNVANDRNYLYNAKFTDESFFSPDILDSMCRSGGINVGHFMCNEYNSTVLEHFLKNGLKLVIHLRDPRQALISWLHHLDKRVHGKPLLMQLLGLNESYFSKSFEEKIKHLIDTQFVEMCKWVASWKKFSEKVSEDCFLMLPHEQLSLDAEEYSSCFAKYLDVPESMLGLAMKPKDGQAHFRKGVTDEWQQVLSLADKDKMEKIMKEYQIFDFLQHMCEKQKFVSI
ncbi:MAG: sulfotransferase domain-containing protein [Aestuariibacter sp.]